jgi:polyisoprenoid-binding protein YceI
VPTASFDLGMKDYNAEVRKAEWFDSKTYPHASFVVSKLTVQSATQALVEGTFTLKGKVQVLSLPVTIQGKRYSGQFNVSRKAFGLGSKDWDEVLDDTVLVKFVLVTK